MEVRKVRLSAHSRLCLNLGCWHSPPSLTRLRSGSVLSSVTLALRGSAPSRSLRPSSRLGLSSSSLVLPALTKGPGRDEEVLDTGAFSLRSLPALLRLLRGHTAGQEAGGSFTGPPMLRGASHLPRLLLDSKSEVCGAALDDWDGGAGCSAE